MLWLRIRKHDSVRCPWVGPVMETSIDPTKDRKCVVRRYSGDASDHPSV